MLLYHTINHTNFKISCKSFTLHEYFYQPCIYKFLCLKSTHIYARGLFIFLKKNVIAFQKYLYRRLIAKASLVGMNHSFPCRYGPI
jgi:hypothetical protein